MKRKGILATAGVACAVIAGGVGVVQAQDGPEEDLPIGFTVQPLAGEQDIDIDEVPPQVRHTANQAAQGADLTEAQIDFDDIEAVYEITGEGIEIDVKTDGKLEEIEEALSAREARQAVPRAVRRLLRRQLPDFEITRSERSTRPTEIGLLRVFYEFDGTDESGEELDVEVNQRGTTYTVEPASLQRPAPGTPVPGS